MSWLGEAKFRIAVALGKVPRVSDELVRIDRGFRAAENSLRLAEAMRQAYMAAAQAQQACHNLRLRLEADRARAQVEMNTEIRLQVFGIKPELAAAIERCGSRK